jgi:hypothetical protein
VALTDEQRTMLQLLLEGGQGYEDIGSLLGIGQDEVRGRARSALREMAGTDPDAQVPLSDYLLGQADPIGRADAVRQLQADPEANAVAAKIVQQLRLLAPRAQLPEIPEPRSGRTATPPSVPPPSPSAAPPSTPPPATTPTGPASQVPPAPGFASRAAGFFSRLGRLPGTRRTQFVVALVAGLAVIVGLVVLTTGGDGGGDNGDCSPLDTSQAEQAGIPTIKLNAIGAAADADCAPTGQITLSAAQQNAQNQQSQAPTFVLQANAAHLGPTENNERYVLWLYKSDQESFPLGQETVDSSGNLTGGVPLVAQQILVLPAFQTVRLSKVNQADAQAIQQAVQAQGKKATGVVPFAGTPVLEGNISELGLEQLLQQAQSQAGGGTGQATPQGGAGNKQAG